MILKNYSIPHSVMLQCIDDETLLFDSATELFFSLNETGAMFWESMSAHTNLDRVYEELLEAYDVAPEQLEEDLGTFVGHLIDQRLVVFSE